MQPYDGADKIFYDEIREKKKETALLRTATQHKRLGAKKVLFATDLMSRKDKLKHTKAGRVMTTNMYENILPIAEFEILEDFEKRNRLQYLRSKYSAKELQAAMGTNSKRYYEIIKELNLPKAPRSKEGQAPKPRKAALRRQEPAAIAIQSNLEMELQAPPETPQQAQPEPVQKIIVNGLNLEFNGTFTADQIIKQFLKFGSLLEGEQDQYYIELRLQQKQP
jgi:hypothetical protein